jgi:hypothetical protein
MNELPSLQNVREPKVRIRFGVRADVIKFASKEADIRILLSINIQLKNV